MIWFYHGVVIFNVTMETHMLQPMLSAWSSAKAHGRLSPLKGVIVLNILLLQHQHNLLLLFILLLLVQVQLTKIQTKS